MLSNMSKRYKITAINRTGIREVIPVILPNNDIPIYQIFDSMWEDLKTDGYTALYLHHNNKLVASNKISKN